MRTRNLDNRKKDPTEFRMRIRTRHPSHRCLKEMLKLLPFRSVMRLGSTTEVLDTVSMGGNIVEINTVKAIKNSASKLLMKECFTLAGVQTADWFILNDKKQFMQQMGPEVEAKAVALKDLPYPIVAKHIMGSRGTGNYKLDDQAAMESFLKTKDLKVYIYEKYYSYAREYRLHITEEGCFYACRKALKKGVAEKDKWHRHDDNCVWFTENIWEGDVETKQPNPDFIKPVNWDAIVAECVKALESTEMDIASFDVRVQAAETEKQKVRTKCEFIIIECNSASSFGADSPNTKVAKKYIHVIPQVAEKKAIEYGVIKKPVQKP